ncbi:MAG TPA: cupin domain-containing protein [Acidimicrobiales bacterium]|nr:cupin domain-containing protein [Acidimicrobiales bacterium]
MAGIVAKKFDEPDETRTPDKARVEVVNLGTTLAARMTLEPGWRWSECIKPIVGTDSCQVHHVGVVVSGKLHIEHSDGTAGDAVAGQAYVIEPGHDAWVLGGEPFVAYEFDSNAAETYAKT